MNIFVLKLCYTSGIKYDAMTMGFTFPTMYPFKQLVDVLSSLPKMDPNVSRIQMTESMSRRSHVIILS